MRYFFTAKDIPGRNNFTPKSNDTSYDEQIFLPLNSPVLFNGQPVGVILADSYELAIRAADQVEIIYMDPSEYIYIYIQDYIT